MVQCELSFQNIPKSLKEAIYQFLMANKGTYFTDFEVAPFIRALPNKKQKFYSDSNCGRRMRELAENKKIDRRIRKDCNYMEFGFI